MDPSVQSILEEEDRRIMEELDLFVNNGHKMIVVAQGTKKRVVEECTRCGFRYRHGKRSKKKIPECPMFVVEKVMES